ncbi:MAG TPA: GTP-sensing pleiotropic transcriptional regulator CodY [Candidatus Avacidaminococcus intestinavium]|uniref:Global transcriptional regulator CodY n=1 Tax=Candidatus Avacidaminococcus intestinavium TaxID=2840684 RepID=A0A9D1SM55_9FIRM|nr:GTP-sensing pleiotropic transcriptional regulator CodY [Candidatus Avacidaminococcus intestinavium]
MQTLLEKTREIHSLLHKQRNVDFDQLVKVLSDVIAASSYIVGNDGSVIGFSPAKSFSCDIVQNDVLDTGKFPETYIARFLSVNSTVANIELKDSACDLRKNEECIFGAKYTTVVPIYGGGERLATFILTKITEPFNTDDLILGEYAATVIGIEILNAKKNDIEENAQKKAMVKIAFSTLSFSELEAIIQIIGALDGTQGILVASKIADKAGITRSVIVNALRKFESAGLIETRSLGMKGTFIRLLNEYILDELKKYQQ